MATTAVVPQPSSPNNNPTSTNLEKIESFLNDTLYKEAIESSANYNTRLCIERRLRLPFIDTQTGVAQNHSALFMDKRQRLPGLLPGQIYTYPRQRWRKKRRQYLTMNSRAFARAADAILDGEGDVHNISTIENPALQDTDSKDSQLLLKDEVSKEWFYDEQDMLEIDPYDEPDPDSDLDYEESYSKRRKGKRSTGRGRSGTDSPSTPGRRKGGGRGRKKATPSVGGHSFEPTPGDPDKPFSCELCGARYKTRPGLTYHYRHSHLAEGGVTSDDGSSQGAPPPATSPLAAPVEGGGASVAVATPPAAAAAQPTNATAAQQAAAAAAAAAQQQGQVYQDSYVSFLNQSPGGPARGGRSRQPQQPPSSQQPPNPSMQIPPMPHSPHPPPGVVPPPTQSAPPNLPPNLPASQTQGSNDDPPMPVLVPEKAIETPQASSGSSQAVSEVPEKKSVPPSPYCDFCLGDSTQNKKTGGIEELVSCSDCGRSGHPTCLQFTENMKVSVKKYRWQCIECKNCSVCGTSDNDDQLLFCDDCDRGYHMYCLSPPLVNPPEGSWSCKLCLSEFHK